MVIGCFAIWLRFSGLALIDWCVCVGLLGVVGLLFICCLLIAVVFVSLIVLMCCCYCECC